MEKEKVERGCSAEREREKRERESGWGERERERERGEEGKKMAFFLLFFLSVNFNASPPERNVSTESNNH